MTRCQLEEIFGQCYQEMRAISRNLTAKDGVEWSDHTRKRVFPVSRTLSELSILWLVVGQKKLWKMLHDEPFVPTLGVLTGNQGVQVVQAGLKAIYVSGWQVAADANLSGNTYPDQSLYPADSVPML